MSTDHTTTTYGLEHGQHVAIESSGMLDRGSAFFTQSLPHLLGSEVPIRDVGVTASEATGLPLHSSWNGGVLWTQRELLEFEHANGDLYWAWGLEEGEYSLIISGRNGLLRYRMNDLVQVVGRYQNTPIIRFVGKAGRFLNATGEKVSEQQLTMAIAKLNIRMVGFWGISNGLIYKSKLQLNGTKNRPVSELSPLLDQALQSVALNTHQNEAQTVSNLFKYILYL